MFIRRDDMLYVVEVLVLWTVVIIIQVLRTYRFHKLVPPSYNIYQRSKNSQKVLIMPNQPKQDRQQEAEEEEFDDW